MNGYGHFVPIIFWSITYWFAIFAVLGVISIAYTRRGTEDSLAARTRLALARAPRLAPAAIVFLLLAVGSGAWFFYNAHVLNEYLTAKDRRHIQAGYERDFKKYQLVPAAQGHRGRHQHQHLSSTQILRWDGPNYPAKQDGATDLSDSHHRRAAVGIERKIRSAVPPGQPRAA